MKEITTISIEEGLLKRARKEAKRRRRSFSAQLEEWLEEILNPKKEG